jgi:hypothetical protein
LPLLLQCVVTIIIVAIDSSSLDLHYYDVKYAAGCMYEDAGTDDTSMVLVDWLVSWMVILPAPTWKKELPFLFLDSDTTCKLEEGAVIVDTGNETNSSTT